MDSLLKQTSIGKTELPKLLSLVVTGRNDNYMGNFQYRLATCLNYIARHLRDLGRLNDVEVLITDWNSEVPLSKVLPLSPDAGHICRFVCVPPQIAQTQLQPGEVFYPTCAINTSVRRAQGQFVMLFDADSLFPRYSLQALLDLLDSKTDVLYPLDRVFYFGHRYQVPWEIVQREPSLDEWDRYFVLNNGQLPPDSLPYGLGIFGAAQMMHRSIWHACRGYNQQLRVQGWLDGELTLRVTQRYPWINLASLGISIFHMEHWAHGRRIIGGQSHNVHSVSATFQVNDENWGLGNFELEIQSAENIRPDRSVTNNRSAAWKQTRQQVLIELTEHQLRQHLNQTVCSGRAAPTEWGSFYALAWYSLYHYPRTYLEFGIRSAQAAALVAAACPGVEIYGIDSWASDGAYAAPPPSYATTLLQSVGYRGYIRFIGGEVETAFDRLCASAVGPLQLDLVFLRGDLFGANTLQQIAGVMPHLAPGGALVFTSASREQFDAVWSQVRAQYPNFTFWQCADRHTGLAVTTTLQLDESAPLSSIAEEIRLARAWNRLLISRACFAFWRKRIRSIWEQLRHQPIRRWPAVLRSRWSAFRQRWNKQSARQS